MFTITCLYDFNYSNIAYDPGATIFVEINGTPFPDDEWYDLPVSVLDMWCSNLIKNSKPSSAEFSLYFMDGPYFIKCIKDNSVVKMQFIDNHGDDEHVLIECDLSFHELAKAIYEAAVELVFELTNHKIVRIPVLPELKKKLKKMEKKL